MRSCRNEKIIYSQNIVKNTFTKFGWNRSVLGINIPLSVGNRFLINYNPVISGQNGWEDEIYFQAPRKPTFEDN